MRPGDQGPRHAVHGRGSPQLREACQLVGRRIVFACLVIGLSRGEEPGRVLVAPDPASTNADQKCQRNDNGDSDQGAVRGVIRLPRSNVFARSWEGEPPGQPSASAGSAGASLSRNHA